MSSPVIIKKTRVSGCARARKRSEEKHTAHHTRTLAEAGMRQAEAHNVAGGEVGRQEEEAGKR